MQNKIEQNLICSNYWLEFLWLIETTNFLSHVDVLWEQIACFTNTFRQTATADRQSVFQEYKSTRAEKGKPSLGGCVLVLHLANIFIVSLKLTYED